MLLSFCLGGQISGKQEPGSSGSVKTQQSWLFGLQEHSQCGFHLLLDSHRLEIELPFAGFKF